MYVNKWNLTDGKDTMQRNAFNVGNSKTQPSPIKRNDDSVDVNIKNYKYNGK